MSDAQLNGVNAEQPRNHGKSSHPPQASKERHSTIKGLWNKVAKQRPREGARDARQRSIVHLTAEMNMDEHLIPVDDLFRRLEVDPEKGLSSMEAASRLTKNGPNALSPPKKDPEVLKWFKATFSGFGPLMLAAALASLIAYLMQFRDGVPAMDNMYVFIVLTFILLLTGTFSYWQTHRSEKIMESFTKMTPKAAKVLRDGKWQDIAADQLVLGDIVEVMSGHATPADLRIIKYSGLKVDNSALTGENDPLSRTTQSDENPLESHNLMFYTTHAVEGSGTAIVIKTGDQTFMGRIAKLTANVGPQQTPIAVEIQHCVNIIWFIALTMGALYVIAAFSMGVDWLMVITLSIGLMAGNLPGGLLIMVTAMLSLAAKHLAKKNCLIKKLEAVETLGSCSIICSDKTGTLTQNRMTISHVWVDDAVFLNETATEPDTVDGFRKQSPSMPILIQAASLCLRAKFKEYKPDAAINSREVEGDASETAILKFLSIITGDRVPEARKDSPPLAEIPFNSTVKYQASVHRRDGLHLVVMKGAPEVVVGRCETILVNGKTEKLGKKWEEKFQEMYDELGELGERVIGFCDCELDETEFPEGYEFNVEEKNFPLDGMRFLGLMSMLDPPRAAVPDAVSKCRSAGVRVIMVTGDHPVTAAAIARSVGIISAESYTVEELARQRDVDYEDILPGEATAAVIHGTDLKELSQAELVQILTTYPEIVFARTSPQQKLQIVEACQSTGAIVAVTGDGVNDAPALKKADIGVSMGITGNDVSVESADLVLMDDNFASIINGIEEGRMIFDNIKKTCCYAMTTDIPEAAPVILYLVLNCPLGLYTISMILLNCATDLYPAVSLAYEPAESDTMKLPPRKRSERLITSNLVQAVYLQIGIIESVGAFFVYFVIYTTQGFYPRRLLGLREEWEDSTITDLKDSFGQEWNFAQRKQLEHVVQSAFFISVVLQNIVHLCLRRCRRVSVFQKPLSNHHVPCAWLFELALACFCVYTPYLQDALGYGTMWFPWVFAVLPFAMYLFVYDELRRLLIRHFPGSWADRNLYV
ncbi:sodium/potassium-transporting ATPase subunit alpha-2-like [Paramacrobiotus metropolitanus]|uniref:sodium/potassium-transporting ATPase subunit alpha-2-like n=1 Tax=Paramacrobiotus metropolitanus TaxID=2943436 RepID=UPI0024457C80|nr:sodium/potassium-transporting ATPase subunit alpha-2-like [Paramacrobiotus metropolitanus]